MQKELITHLLYWLFKAKKSGLLFEKRDPRNYQASSLGWGFSYSPKSTEKTIHTLGIKDQKQLNTCVFNSGTAQKEVDENCFLSVRRAVSRGVKKRQVSGNGFSSLKSFQENLKADGIEEADNLSELSQDWRNYCVAPLDPAKASKHKSKSYWEINSVSQALEAIDNGHAIHFGMTWYTGFNQGGGFNAPWIISKAVGYTVGGHAVLAIGYNSKGLIKVQNSYGEEWGDKGCFYITYAYFENQIRKWGAFCNLDMDKDSASFVSEYGNKNVRVADDCGLPNGSIWMVVMGKRALYNRWVDYVCWNGRVKGYIQLSEEETKTLKGLPEGEPLKAENSPFFIEHKEQLAELQDPKLVEKVLEIIHKDK